MIFKKRQAVKKEQACNKCKKVIGLKEQYWDTGIKIGKKPWETEKVCLDCGEKMMKEKN